MTESSVRDRGVVIAGGLAGLVALILMVVAADLVPVWPPAASSPERITEWFLAHRTGFLAQVWLFGAAGALLIPWAAAWHATFSKEGSSLAGIGVVSGTILFVAPFGIFVVPWIEIANHPELPAPTIRAFYDVGLLGQFPGVGMPLALLFVSLGVGGARTRMRVLLADRRQLPRN